MKEEDGYDALREISNIKPAADFDQFVFYLGMFDDLCACLDSHVLFSVGQLPEAVEHFLGHLVRRRGDHDRHLGEGDGAQRKFKFISHARARVFCFDQVALPLRNFHIVNFKLRLFSNVGQIIRNFFKLI